ncbi:MAG: hypothetical protein RLZ44_1088 [Pseudomonadota bacterium]
MNSAATGRRRLALAGMLTVLPAAAHEVTATLEQSPAVVITLQYADGRPFAYEGYELYPDGAEVPAQVGRTDAAGRVVFLARTAADWRLKAVSEDGHGIDRHFRAPAGAGATAPGAAAGLDRNARLLVGAALLFGVFGLLQLYLRKRKSR